MSAASADNSRRAAHHQLRVTRCESNLIHLVRKLDRLTPGTLAHGAVLEAIAGERQTLRDLRHGVWLT